MYEYRIMGRQAKLNNQKQMGQGKRNSQTEFSYYMAVISMAGIVAIGIISIVYYLTSK